MRTKREMSWMGLENSHVEKMGQYSMEDVSLIVMYGDASLESPKCELSLDPEVAILFGREIGQSNDDILLTGDEPARI
jgi:hypothetical protein